MHRPDHEKFRAMLDAMANLYGRDAPDDLTVQTYWSALKDLPWEIVEACAKAHQRYGKFFPKPVELRPRDERPKQNLPTGESRNHVRDYWRSCVVNEAAESFGYRFMPEKFGKILVHEPSLAGQLRDLISEMEQQESRGERSEGQHRYVQRMVGEFSSAMSHLRANNYQAVEALQ